MKRRVRQFWALLLSLWLENPIVFFSFVGVRLLSSIGLLNS